MGAGFPAPTNWSCISRHGYFNCASAKRKPVSRYQGKSGSSRTSQSIAQPPSPFPPSFPIAGTRARIRQKRSAGRPLPPSLEARLKGYLASKHYRQNELGLLFQNRRGRPFSANKLREKKLRPLLRSLGIPLAGFHAFRHGHATLLIDQGASITTVGAQLRHSDPRITLGLYAHVVPQSQRKAVDALAGLSGEANC
jgi:hypothetical protein